METNASVNAPLATAYRLALARTYVHVTSTRNGGVYGHTTDRCDAAGCAGDECFFSADDYPELYDDGEPVVERGDTADLGDEALDQFALAAREAWAASDEVRTYEVRDDNASWTIESSPMSLLADVRDSVLDGDWDRSASFVEHVRVVCEETDESESFSVRVDAEAPECTAASHDWQSPHEVVGGLKENPGVHGHGGGVIVKEVCSHCGAYKITDTWADDGRGGNTELINYEEADDDSRDWLATIADDRMLEACPYELQERSTGEIGGKVSWSADVDDELEEAAEAAANEARDAGPDLALELRDTAIEARATAIEAEVRAAIGSGYTVEITEGTLYVERS